MRIFSQMGIATIAACCALTAYAGDKVICVSKAHPDEKRVDLLFANGFAAAKLTGVLPDADPVVLQQLEIWFDDPQPLKMAPMDHQHVSSTPVTTGKVIQLTDKHGETHYGSFLISVNGADSQLKLVLGNKIFKENYVCVE